MIIADPYGTVHVFWVEDLDGEPQVTGEPLHPGNAILHRSYDGEAWSPAVDLFYAGSAGQFFRPAAAVDPAGTLHLAWVTGDHRLLYSRAPAHQAGQVRAWLPPLELDARRVLHTRLLALPDGALLALYSVPLGPEPGLWTVRIDPGGQPGKPQLAWHGPGRRAPQWLGAAVDPSGTVHVTWEAIDPPSPAAVEVRYARSLDGGLSWEPSRRVASPAGGHGPVGLAMPWVYAGAGAEIHLQWAQGQAATRWHQVSGDGGRTWLSPQPVSPDLYSQTSSQAVALDGDGQLYWADVLRYPNAAYLLRWTGRAWTPPEPFFFIDPTQPSPQAGDLNLHHLRMAIAGGDRLHVLFLDQERGELWTMQRRLAARSLPPVPTPVPPTATTVSPSSPAPDPPPTASGAALTSRQPSRPAASQGLLLLAGALPACLIVAAAAGWKARRR